MLRTLAAQLIYITERAFIFMTDKLEIENHQDSGCTYDCTQENPGYHLEDDFNKSQRELTNLGGAENQDHHSSFYFYEPGQTDTSALTGFAYEHHSDSKNNLVLIRHINSGAIAGTNVSEAANQKSTQVDSRLVPSKQENTAIYQLPETQPTQSQRTISAFEASDNMAANNQHNLFDKPQPRGPSANSAVGQKVIYKSQDGEAAGRGYLISLPHDRRQRNLAGQEANFMSMRVMHGCDETALMVEPDYKELARPNKQQLYSERSEVRERVKVIYERDVSASCYSEQDDKGNNVFVILSDNIGRDYRFGDYVIGTVPTQQPERFLSNRLSRQTSQMLLQAQQQYQETQQEFDNRYITDKNVAAWWEKQEACVIPTVITPKGPAERETLAEYTESTSNTSDYYESTDDVSHLLLFGVLFLIVMD